MHMTFDHTRIEKKWSYMCAKEESLGTRLISTYLVMGLQSWVEGMGLEDPEWLYKHLSVIYDI